MAIEFTCPTCKKALKLRDEAAGKTGKCPYCKSVITVPVSALAEDDLIEIVPAGAPQAKKVPPALPKPAQPPVATTPVTPATPAAATKPCPGCGKPLPEKAVICVNCGFNLKTGKKLQTVFEAPPPEPQKPAEAPKPKAPEPPKT